MKIEPSSSMAKEKSEYSEIDREKYRVYAPKRNLPSYHNCIDAVVICIYRRKTTEENIIFTLLTAAINNNISFEYNRLSENDFTVYSQDILVCSATLDEIEALFQVGLLCYISYWQELIKRVTDKKKEEMP